jgi:uncharacterized integral membrane protein
MFSAGFVTKKLESQSDHNKRLSLYLLTAIGLSPVAEHIYTQTMHRQTQITTEQHK